MAHCQICEREIKSKFGLIAHHGYTRPELGWQTESCMGARQLPYEKSRDAIPKTIQSIDSFIGLNKAKIKAVQNKEISVPNFLSSQTSIEPSNPMYGIRSGEYIDKLNSQVSMAEKDKERLQKRFDNWKGEENGE